MSDLGPSRYRIVAGAAVPVPIPEQPRRLRLAARIARVVVASLCWVYGLAACGFHAAVLLAPAGSWQVHLLLYGPRWLIALPPVILVPAALLLRLRWCSLPLSLGAYSLAAVWGVNVPWERLVPGGGLPGEPLRVLTCNVQRHDLKVRVMADYIAATRPDVICFQDCDLTDPKGALGLDGWHARAVGEFCLASRYPIEEFAEMRVPTAGKGTRKVAVRARLLRPGGPVTVVSVHLESPRWGLQDVIDRRWEGLPKFRSVAATQDSESRDLRSQVDALPRPTVIAGDFNLTAEHPIYRRDWSDFRDAFSWTAWGLGHTFFTRSIGLRIDHILCGPGWTPRSCRMGPDIGSEHLPVVAELTETRE